MNTNTPAALPPAVREVLADAAPILSEVRGGEALLSALSALLACREEEGEGEFLAFALAEGLYWAAVWNYEGERDALYLLPAALKFRPGVLSRGPEAGSLAEDIAGIAEDYFRGRVR